LDFFGGGDGGEEKEYMTQKNLNFFSPMWQKFTTKTFGYNK
jgi:hypothetical protein